jgi:hypothetical protein
MFYFFVVEDFESIFMRNITAIKDSFPDSKVSNRFDLFKTHFRKIYDSQVNFQGEKFYNYGRDEMNAFFEDIFSEIDSDVDYNSIESIIILVDIELYAQDTIGVALFKYFKEVYVNTCAIKVYIMYAALNLKTVQDESDRILKTGSDADFICSLKMQMRSWKLSVN